MNFEQYELANSFQGAHSIFFILSSQHIFSFIKTLFIKNNKKSNRPVITYLQKDTTLKQGCTQRLSAMKNKIKSGNLQVSKMLKIAKL